MLIKHSEQAKNCQMAINHCQELTVE